MLATFTTLYVVVKRISNDAKDPGFYSRYSLISYLFHYAEPRPQPVESVELDV